MNTLDEKKKSLKEKVMEVKTKVKTKVDGIINFAKNNPMETAALATAGAGALASIYKIGRGVASAIDNVNSQKQVYCNDIQATVKLRHSLTYSEARELRDRMNAGQTKFEALDQMGLLKK